jgi:hypothetical protein
MSVIRNPNLGSSQVKARRRRLFWIRTNIILFLVLIVVFGLAILSGYQKVRVQTIIVSGNAVVSADEVLAIANRDMTGRYGYLFAKSNSLIFPRNKIKEDLLKEKMTISDVKISWSDWQKISIEISERKPDSVWCGEEKVSVDSACFFMDRFGYIYDQAPVFSGNIFIRNYGRPITMNASSTDPLGHYFLPSNDYLGINNLIQVLDQNNLRVISVLFDGRDYTFTLESGLKIIFNNREGFSPPFDNFLLAYKAGNIDLSKNDIKYIDLRFSNKIVIGKK